MNSASVAGGAPPAPAHFNFPPQSPVVHVPEPEASKLHPVRPQNRPDQPGGAFKVTEDPEAKANPPSPSAVPPEVRIPGQTVKLQRFVKVKTVPETMEIVPCKYTIPDKLICIILFFLTNYNSFITKYFMREINLLKEKNNEECLCIYTCSYDK